MQYKCTRKATAPSTRVTNYSDSTALFSQHSQCATSWKVCRLFVKLFLISKAVQFD